MKFNNTFLIADAIGQIHTDIKLNHGMNIWSHFYPILQWGTNLHAILPMKH